MSQQVAKREIESVRSALSSPKMKKELQHALPRHLTVERLTRVSMTQLQNNPELLNCDKKTLYAAIMTAAQLGLEPDGILGQAYLVPFKGKVQFIPGYKGLIALARNSGDVININAQAVRENDHFEYRYGLDETLEHIPAMRDRGEITHFYAYAKFKDGGHAWDVMSKEEVDEIRAASPGRNSPAWKNHYGQMGRKTIIRRLANYLPLNVQKAAAMENAFEGGQVSSVVDGEVVIDAPGEEEMAEKTIEGEKAAGGQLDQAFGDKETPADAVEWPDPDSTVVVTMKDGRELVGTLAGVSDGEFLVNTKEGPISDETANVKSVDVKG